MTINCEFQKDDAWFLHSILTGCSVALKTCSEQTESLTSLERMLVELDARLLYDPAYEKLDGVNETNKTIKCEFSVGDANTLLNILTGVGTYLEDKPSLLDSVGTMLKEVSAALLRNTQEKTIHEYFKSSNV
jgi:hypothetical protein